MVIIPAPMHMLISLVYDIVKHQAVFDQVSSTELSYASLYSKQYLHTGRDFPGVVNTKHFIPERFNPINGMD